jgi:hypothetical protein
MRETIGSISMAIGLIGMVGSVITAAFIPKVAVTALVVGIFLLVIGRFVHPDSGDEFGG